MASQIPEQELYEIARRQVRQKKNFFSHLAAYVVVNIFLVFVWAFLAGRGYPWFWWVIGGWGIGLTFHFLDVFVFKNTAWEKQEVEKEMEKLRKGG
jgi:hypothetical protein